MSAEQTRNNRKSRQNDNPDRGSKKVRATKGTDTDQSLHEPNNGHEEEYTRQDHTQPMGEFSDWNKPMEPVKRKKS